MLLKLADSITTDHISPAGSFPASGPAGQWLTERGVDRRDFNSFGSRRGNHEIMMRGTFANVRIRNQMAPGTEGGYALNHETGEVMSVYDAAQIAAPKVVLAGSQYGTGSSRDWAAKGTYLLGVKAVIATSFERIHRSNLVGMGVLPLTFKDGESHESLGLTGHESYTIRHRPQGQCSGRGRPTGNGSERSLGVDASRLPRRGLVLNLLPHSAAY